MASSRITQLKAIEKSAQAVRKAREVWRPRARVAHNLESNRRRLSVGYSATLVEEKDRLNSLVDGTEARCGLLPYPGL